MRRALPDGSLGHAEVRSTEPLRERRDPNPCATPSKKQISHERLNDFVVKFAKVNGTGSASANSLFEVHLPDGHPGERKNYFPSNIQGLPTWYEIRVTEDGYVARSGGIDIMVAMNAETYAHDCARWPRRLSDLRLDLAAADAARATTSRCSACRSQSLCNEKFSAIRARMLFKNIIYAGALAALLDIDLEIMRAHARRELKGKKKLVAAEHEGAGARPRLREEHFDCPLPIQVRPAQGRQGQDHDDGNAAAGLGAIYAGATVCAWYPITPSTSLTEAFERYCRSAARRPGDRQAQFRHRPGRRRAGGHRHRDRRRLERRARLHRHLRPRHLADERIPGPRVFRRGARGVVRHPARRPVHRHADAHPAVATSSRCAYASHGDTKHVLLFPRTRRSASTLARRPSTWPSGCRRR